MKWWQAGGVTNRQTDRHRLRLRHRYRYRHTDTDTDTVASLSQKCRTATRLSDGGGEGRGRDMEEAREGVAGPACVRTHTARCVDCHLLASCRYLMYWRIGYVLIPHLLANCRYFIYWLTVRYRADERRCTTTQLRARRPIFTRYCMTVWVCGFHVCVWNVLYTVCVDDIDQVVFVFVYIILLSGAGG